MARITINQIPPVDLLGPDVAAAEDNRTAAVTARDEAQETVRALLAGGSRFNPVVLGSADRPSDAEKEAIAADERLIGEAIEAGQDVAQVGTPNHDRYKQDLAEAEARLRHYERKVGETEAALIAALQASKETAREAVSRAVAGASADLLAAIDNVEARRRAKLEAEASLRFIDQLDEKPLGSLGVVIGGRADIPVPGRVHSLPFDVLIATLRQDAQPPAQAEPYLSAVESERKFASDLPKGKRAQLVRDGSVVRMGGVR